jgi:DNA-binding transcriptional LysR family regulator
METRILKYFLTVAKLGTISAAARTLHVAQPTMSRQIQQLEEQLGTLLFIRERRRMVLTKAGLAYQLRVEQILAELDRANQVVATINNNELTGQVGIGCVESAITKFLVPLLNEFHQKYPQVTFEMCDADGDLIKNRLDRGSLEIGIVSTPINAAKYHYLRLPLDDQWGIAVNQNSYFRNQKTVNVSDLKGHPLIMPGRSLVYDEISDWLKAGEQELNVVATYNLLTNAAYLAAAGLGDLICIKDAPLPKSTNLTFIPLVPERKLEHYLIWRKGISLSEPAQRLVNLLHSQLTTQ